MPFATLKYQALLLMVVHTGFLGAQNLLRNPGFEQYRECPQQLGNFHADVEHWSSPTEASTDYFNACSEAMGTPENFNGSQTPESGSAYAGLYLFAPNDYREYVQGELIKPMVKGADYKIGFYLCLAERSDFAIRQLGLVFSRDKLELPIKKELSKMQLYRDRSNSYSFIQLTHSGFLDDTDQWVHLTADYTATGLEKFIIIGNFENNAGTLTRKTNRNAKQGAYYYIDMVTVLPSGLAMAGTDSQQPPEDLAGYALDTEHQFHNVLFGFDDYRLNPEAKTEIRKLYDYMVRYDDLNITINGHTDNVGSDSYNRNLAASRCRSVTNFLLELGLPGERIRWESHGFEQPVADNTTEEGRMRNRRVAFSLSKRE